MPLAGHLLRRRKLLQGLLRGEATAPRRRRPALPGVAWTAGCSPGGGPTRGSAAWSCERGGGGLKGRRCGTKGGRFGDSKGAAPTYLLIIHPPSLPKNVWWLAAPPLNPHQHHLTRSSAPPSHVWGLCAFSIISAVASMSPSVDVSVEARGFIRAHCSVCVWGGAQTRFIS